MKDGFGTSSISLVASFGILILIFDVSAGFVPSRNPVSCAPRRMVRTCSFHTMWLLHTSFSETGIKAMIVTVELEAAIVVEEKQTLDVLCGGGSSIYHVTNIGW
jgi:hypothetical protein